VSCATLGTSYAGTAFAPKQDKKYNLVTKVIYTIKQISHTTRYTHLNTLILLSQKKATTQKSKSL